MEINRQTEILIQANNNLKILFPDRHKTIVFNDVNMVYNRNVLGISADFKTRKGTKYGYLTGIMYLAPYKLSGLNMCPMASKGCAVACLFSAGRGKMYFVTRARVVKTLAYHFNETRFIDTIKESIRQLIVKAKNKNMTPVVRLNGTSDILWERRTDILQSFPNIQFYDYTKIAQRFRFSIPSNYHLTFSLSESNQSDAVYAVSRGINVAAVFREKLPKKLFNRRVVNGDDTDLRFLDRHGVIIGLKAKGKAKKDKSGFVKDVQ